MSAAQHAWTPGPPQAVAVPGRWSVIPAASRAGFHVRDKLVTTVHGTMPVEDGGIVISGPGDVTQAWLTVSVAGIATGNTHRDRDLLAARFLDAARSPAIRVSVDTATPTADGWTATGTLQARGASAPVDLAAVVVGESASQVRIRVTARLDRRPLAMKVPTFVVGRFVDLEADLTFRPGHDVEPSPGTGAPR